MGYLLDAILIYFAFLFVFRFVVPLVIASRKIKKGFREMQEKMQSQPNQQEFTTHNQAESKSKYTPPKSDYIEFEEL